MSPFPYCKLLNTSSPRRGVSQIFDASKVMAANNGGVDKNGIDNKAMEPV